MSKPTERCEVVDQLIAWLEEAFEAGGVSQEAPNVVAGVSTPTDRAQRLLENKNKERTP